MGKKVKGSLKCYQFPGTARTGYRDTWDMGRAARAKKRWRVTGPNRPGT